MPRLSRRQYSATPRVRRADAEAVTARSSLRRFALLELALWGSIYPAYLAVRGMTIGNPGEATAHALRVVDLERVLSLLHEHALQNGFSFATAFFSTYYIVGFAPLIASTLIWLGLRHRESYCELRTPLFLSLSIAVVLYVLYPMAPPRLVPGLGPGASLPPPDSHCG